MRWLSKITHISKQMYGEAGDLDNLLVADEIACLQNEISKCDPEFGYNMDETGLNYRFLEIFNIFM